MKLNENGETFTEDVIVDLKENTEEIKVPQHQDRAELDLLNDFNMVKYNSCYIYAFILTMFLKYCNYNRFYLYVLT